MSLLRNGMLGVLSLMLSACVVLPKTSEDLDSLSGCLPFPNCVSTQSASPIHKLNNFTLTQPIDQAWPKILAQVESLPNIKIVQQDGFYVYAKAYSQLFRFVDYVEVFGREDSNELQVRSSSMLGLSDLGVNRNRVEQLREGLHRNGLIE